jgi:hypothetical protein
MKTITMPFPRFLVHLGEPDADAVTEAYKGGRLEGGFERATCPCCDQADCHFDCDGSKAEDSPETEEEALERARHNAGLDALEGLILAHAIAGIDITTPAYLEGVQTALDALGNNL